MDNVTEMNRDESSNDEDYFEQIYKSSYSNKTTCVIASTNLMSFGKWYHVSCTLYIKHLYVICEKPREQNVSKLFLRPRAKLECDKSKVLIYNPDKIGDYNCYRFAQHCNSLNHSRPIDLSINDKNEDTVPQLNPYLSHWAMGLTNTMLYNSIHGQLCLTRLCKQCPYVKYADWIANNNCSTQSTAYRLCVSKPVIHTRDQCSETQFQCKDGTCILNQYECDDIPDCIDRSDELLCDNICTTGFDCFSKCVPGQCQCYAMYVQIEDRCIPIYQWYKQSNTLIDLAKFPFNNNEHDQRDQNETCPPHWSLCTLNNASKCYPNEMVCVLSRNILGDPLYCSNTNHLTHCKQHLCPTMYKCPDTYCIPLFMVCDGVYDCPNQEDESHALCKYFSLYKYR